jgi:hypothetical protein
VGKIGDRLSTPSSVQHSLTFVYPNREDTHLGGIVHGKTNAWAFEIENFQSCLLAAGLGREYKLELASAWNNSVGGTILQPTSEKIRI